MKKTLVQQILDAASAQDVESGDSGAWSIKKLPIVGPKPLVVKAPKEGKDIVLPPGVYTSLFCMTEATLMSGGELVMHDFPDELLKHLEFMRRAKGRVLITGLGLGCVARGCAANPNVDTVTVIEKSPDVLKLVAPYMGLTGNLPAVHGGSKIEIIHADALRWCKENTQRFDCAWHDLWVPNNTDPHLQQLHMKLICRMADRVDFQGAWEFPRQFRRRCLTSGKVI
jgi:hypothetical protein